MLEFSSMDIAMGKAGNIDVFSMCKMFHQWDLEVYWKQTWSTGQPYSQPLISATGWVNV